MSQNKIIGILTISEDYKSVIKLNSTIYNKLAKKYGKLYIINLSNLLLFGQKKENRSLNLNSHIKIFKPLDFELISFCKNKSLSLSMVWVKILTHLEFIMLYLK